MEPQKLDLCNEIITTCLKMESSGINQGTSGNVSVRYKNGFLIMASAATGKVEKYKKIADSILSPPIISEASLYILTKNSKILGFGD